VLLLPSPLFHSELLSVPPDRFRVGFGRKDIEIGLKAGPLGYLAAQDEP
jgi:hypothetical protein